MHKTVFPPSGPSGRIMTHPAMPQQLRNNCHKMKILMRPTVTPSVWLAPLLAALPLQLTLDSASESFSRRQSSTSGTWDNSDSGSGLWEWAEIPTGQRACSVFYCPGHMRRERTALHSPSGSPSSPVSPECREVPASPPHPPPRGRPTGPGA